MPPPYEGGCLCGRVRYRLEGEPLTVYACHCTDCQRHSGSSFNLSMLVRREKLATIAGAPTEYAGIPTASGQTRRGRFCTQCSSRLWAEPPRAPELLVLRAGTLDDTRWFEPVAHIWTQSAQRWVKIPEGALQFQRQPDDMSVIVRAWLERSGAQHAQGAPEVRREAIDTAAARSLIGALNAELSDRYPEAGATHFRLEAEEVAPGRGAFVVAYIGDRPVGCGAVRALEPGTAEVRRMYVVPEMRGKRIGTLVLSTLEREATSLGVSRIVLETGPRQPDAMAVYRKAGFEPIPLFGEYIGSELSVCMEKKLRQ